jgi:probable F420-dependent oxidoreductase
MKIGISVINAGGLVDAGPAGEIARHAEEMGIESLWAVEHVVVPFGYTASYPYSTDGKMPTPEDQPTSDPLIWLAFAAAMTTKIKIATGILVLPYRHPMILAKQCASLDRLAAGRFLLGIGVGWLHDEFDALGADWSDRAAITDEYVDAMRALWTSTEASFHGRHNSFDLVACEPKPLQPTVPIVVGGHSASAAKRAGRLGDGFYPVANSVEHLKTLIDTMRDTARASKRDPKLIEITSRLPQDRRELVAVERLGVSRLIAPIPRCELDGQKQFISALSAEFELL